MEANKFRNSLINAATPAETRLLQLLNNEPLLKNKYRLHVYLKPFFVDFYIPSKKLVVEVDGSSHMDKRITDKERTSILIEKYKVKVIRVSNSQVFRNHKSVISKILRYSALKHKIKDRADFYGFNPLAVSRGALKASRKRNSRIKRAATVK